MLPCTFLMLLNATTECRFPKFSVNNCVDNLYNCVARNLAVNNHAQYLFNIIIIITKSYYNFTMISETKLYDQNIFIVITFIPTMHYHRLICKASNSTLFNSNFDYYTFHYE